jgi:hypothetical protein
MAWTVLSAAYKACRQDTSTFESFLIVICFKVFQAQTTRDANIGRLVDAMNDIYGFLQEAEPLRKIESHKRIITHIMQQTTECGYFIRDYSKNKNFCTFVFLYPKN